MSFEITVVRGRTRDFSGTLYESDETTPITPDTGSVVRFKAGRRNLATPVLEISSVAANANGSVMTLDISTGAWTMKIAQGDTAELLPGPYEAEIALVDSGDDDLIKSAEQGVLNILPALAGDIGLT